VEAGGRADLGLGRRVVTLRVVVVGPGAVGSFLGAVLAKGGADVTLVGRGDAPSERGALRLEDASGAVSLEVTRAGAGTDRADSPELVILAVKLFDLDSALDVAARWPDATVLTVQNGVDAEASAATQRHSPLLAGSLTTSVVAAPGGVRRLTRGGLGLASVRGVDAPGLEALASTFEAGGLKTRIYPDATAMKWSKLVANLVGNATSAILDMDPGAVYADPSGFAVERRQLLEARSVMRAVGVAAVDLPGAPVRPLLLGARLPPWLGRPILARAIAAARGGKSPSLRLHVRGGEGSAAQPGPTEVRWLNGAVARYGADLGSPAPANAAVEALVEEVASDADRATWFARRPDRLHAAVDQRRDAVERTG
jgi:2-dehydropantoate 2-reductase